MTTCFPKIQNDQHQVAALARVPGVDRQRGNMNSAGVQTEILDSLGNTYEITQPIRGKDLENQIFSKLLKYRLQTVSRSLLPEFRVSKCLRFLNRRLTEMGVKIWQSIRFGTTHFSGLICCGSVWVCPVCAGKISEVRRNDLEQAISDFRLTGGGVFMLTLTAPHKINQPCKRLLTQFRNARRLFRNRKAWKSFSQAVGLLGTVTALEVTYGSNGWHIHTHELLFLKSRIDEDELMRIAQARFSRRRSALSLWESWQNACMSSGLGIPSIEHGLTLNNGDYAAKYASKWGLDCELTKSHIKKGKEGGMTPFDMLRDVLDTGDMKFGKLFRNFAFAFKGSRQLVWSDGLRELCGLDQELSDEEIAEQHEDDAILLGTLTEDQWNVVLSSDRRAEILIQAQLKGWPGVIEYIDKLVCPGVGFGSGKLSTVVDRSAPK